MEYGFATKEDFIKWSTNNWRKMHGLPMYRWRSWGRYYNWGKFFRGEI